MMMAELRAHRSCHALWENRLFQAMSQGTLTRDELRFVFSQYALHPTSYTRYLAALMVNCEDELVRTRIAESLWEEAGGSDQGTRHAQLYRDFLQSSFGVAPDLLQFTDSARYFVRECLDVCSRSSTAEGAAFLALGMEGVVAEMYAIFARGMRRAGLEDDELTLFRVLVDRGTSHASRLESVVRSRAHEANWFDATERSMNRALDLRLAFFESLFETIHNRRLSALVDGMQARPTEPPAIAK